MGRGKRRTRSINGPMKRRQEKHSRGAWRKRGKRAENGEMQKPASAEISWTDVRMMQPGEWRRVSCNVAATDARQFQQDAL